MPEVQNQGKGLYEVIWHLSDLNYIMRVLRMKEIVVNMNRMKRCF